MYFVGLCITLLSTINTMIYTSSAYLRKNMFTKRTTQELGLIFFIIMGCGAHINVRSNDILYVGKLILDFYKIQMIFF